MRRKASEAKRKVLQAEADKARREGRAPEGKKAWWEEEMEAEGQEEAEDDDVEYYRQEVGHKGGGGSVCAAWTMHASSAVLTCFMH